MCIRDSHMTISPDNKLTIAKVPFYCQLMEWGKFPIYLTLKCINIFFCHHLALSFRRMPMRNGRLCHSDDCKEEESPLLCARRAFISHCHQHFSFRCFPFKYTYGLWQAIRTVVQSAWHSCATAMAQSCQRRGTSMPKGWHEQSIPSTPRPLCFLCPPSILTKGLFIK